MKTLNIIINGNKHVVNTSAKMSKAANDILFASSLSKRHEIEIRNQKIYVIEDNFWLECKEAVPLDLVKPEFERRKEFNKKVSPKQRGRLYKLTRYIKELISKYNGWMEDIQPNEIMKFNLMCQKWHIDRELVYEVLMGYTYIGDDTHVFTPPTFEFMVELEELRRGKLLRNF